MSRDIASKQRLLTWAEEQDLEFRTRYILEKLASFAGPDRKTWAPIAYLAKVAQCSERKVQYCLAKIKEEGLIEATGQRKRLDDSTRSVPIYLIAPGWNAEMTAHSMGANPAPIEPDPEGYGCKNDGVWVHRACTPKDPKDPKEFAIAHSAGERDALVEGYGALEAATPKRVLGVTDPDEALAAYAALAAEGVDVAELPGCARRMAEDPAFKTRKFPVPLEVWLAKRQFRAWWPDEAVAEAPPPIDPVEALPAEVIAVFGLDFVRAWLGGATWRDEDRTIVTVRGIQRDKLRRDRAALLIKHGIRVESVADAAARGLEGTE